MHYPPTLNIVDHILLGVLAQTGARNNCFFFSHSPDLYFFLCFCTSHDCFLKGEQRMYCVVITSFEYLLLAMQSSLNETVCELYQTKLRTMSNCELTELLITQNLKGWYYGVYHLVWVSSVSNAKYLMNLCENTANKNKCFICVMGLYYTRIQK